MPHRIPATCFLLLFVTACAGTPHKGEADDGARATLAILESTDVHSNVMSYDYYRLAEDPTLGFERLATLVREARREFPNNLLFDAGDTIQGTALADWQARGEPLACGDKLAMYKAMDALGYDGGTIGNHEFNYGLPFLDQVTDARLDVDGVTPRRCTGPDFPLVLANVDSARTGKPLFAPSAVLERRIKAVDAHGREVESSIRIGIIGFTPPPILEWDKDNLAGRVTVSGVVEAARRHLPALRAQGVDLVVAISHGGINPSAYTSDMENANWHLAAEPGIDVLLLGHSHQAFPDPGNAKSRFATMPEVDNERGFLRGKPAVMGNFWGKSLGVVELALVREDGRWRIDAPATHAEVRDLRLADGRFVAPDPAIAAAIRAEHEATIRYVSTPIGSTDFAMGSQLTVVGDVSTIEPVNRAQQAYVERHIGDTRPDLAGIPVLSAVAPFKVGFGGAGDFTDIAAGPLAIRNAADLYQYPNTIAALRLDGAGIKAWLERSAGYFNTIDPSSTQPQELVNRRFPAYNFDIIQGAIRYRIDLAKPPGARIVDLEFRGRPIDPAAPFLLVTNNYRAGGGGDFPGADADHAAFDSPIMNRDVLIEWIRARGRLTRAADAGERPWRFVPMQTRGAVTFTSASGQLDRAHAAGIEGVRLVRDHGDGMATYAIDLSSPR
ncbi:MAG: bifunctional 2',3'-cyclic-nucleotide 2'-phosphodiesterase/3'-nucleotidase [Xanthomonadales bacterium]|nr:bifunctional 2',3'-cyclic-nucleotide 2'-phosphodiesterase/3'-nucleotidase [Xanthomonadales bacterium]